MVRFGWVYIRRMRLTISIRPQWNSVNRPTIVLLGSILTVLVQSLRANMTRSNRSAPRNRSTGLQDLSKTMEGLTLRQLGLLINEYFLESNHNNWDGFSHSDK